MMEGKGLRNRMAKKETLVSMAVIEEKTTTWQSRTKPGYKK